MPIYEYECKSCHDVIELLEKSDVYCLNDLCPSCGPGSVSERIISPTPGFVIGGTPRLCKNSRSK